jgi:hypothetical protein
MKETKVNRVVFEGKLEDKGFDIGEHFYYVGGEGINNTLYLANGKNVRIIIEIEEEE